MVSTRSFRKKKCNYLKLFFLPWILLSIILADSDISYNLKETTINNAINFLIDEYDLIIIFPDQLSELKFSGECNKCTEEEAITIILETTDFSWKKINEQFVIYTPKIKNNSTIYGRVYDKHSNQPIPYANIYIQRYDEGDMSDHNGFFSVSRVGEKPCSLVVSYIGYETNKQAITVNPKKYFFKEITLTPKVLNSKEISILAENQDFMTESNNPGQLSFSPRHVSSLPNLGEVDIFRSMQFLPGIQLSLGSTSNLNIRGGTSDQNLISLDGMTLYHTSHMFGFISGVSHEIIKDVQIFKGYIPAVNGGRISSLVELTSRTGNNTSLHGSAYGNFMSNGLLAEMPIFKKGSLIINYRKSRPRSQFSKVYESIQKFMTGDNRFNLINAAAKHNTNQNATYNINSSYEDFFSKLSFLINSKNRITLTTIIGQDSVSEDRTFFGFSNILEYDSTNINEKDKIKSRGIVLNLFSDWDNNFTSHFSISKYYFSNHYSSIQSLPFKNDFSSIGSAQKNHFFHDNSIRYSHQYHGIDNHKLVIGLEESFYNLTYREKNIDGNFSRATLLDQNRHLYSFFLQDYWKPKKELEIHIGFRASYLNNINKIYKEPRFAMKYRYNRNLSFEFSFTQNSQFLHHFSTSNNLRVNSGKLLISSKKIPPIISRNYHTGINWESTDYNFTSSIYSKNLNDFSHFNYLSSYQNYLSSFNMSIADGTGNVKGIETLLRKKTGQINGWMAYLFNQTKYYTPQYNNNKQYFANHDKTHEFKSVAITTLFNLNFSISWVFTSGAPFTKINDLYLESGSGYEIFVRNNYNAKRLENTHHLDLSITKLFYLSKVTLDIGFSVYNLFNKKNLTHKRYNPYSGTLSITDVAMFGITPSIHTKISF